MPNLPSEPLARERRRILKAWLRTCPYDWRDIASAVGYELGYFRDLLCGRFPVSDSAAWRLQYRLGVPFSSVEPPPIPWPDPTNFSLLKPSTPAERD